MRTMALVARQGRIDYVKLAAVSGALLGSWALFYGAIRAFAAVIG